MVIRLSGEYSKQPCPGTPGIHSTNVRSSECAADDAAWECACSLAGKPQNLMISLVSAIALCGPNDFGNVPYAAVIGIVANTDKYLRDHFECGKLNRRRINTANSSVMYIGYVTGVFVSIDVTNLQNCDT